MARPTSRSRAMSSAAAAPVRSAIRCSASSCRTVPTRQGTHCPHDSSRKNSAMRSSSRGSGTVRQEEALHRIAERTGTDAAADITLLREVGRAMRDASICGLGQTAWNAVESAIDRLGAYE